MPFLCSQRTNEGYSMPSHGVSFSVYSFSHLHTYRRIWNHKMRGSPVVTVHLCIQFWSSSKRAHSKKEMFLITFQKKYVHSWIPFCTHSKKYSKKYSKKGTFQKEHMPNRAHFKKSTFPFWKDTFQRKHIAFWSHSKKSTSTYFDHIQKRVYPKKNP